MVMVSDAKSRGASRESESVRRIGSLNDGPRRRSVPRAKAKHETPNAPIAALSG